MGKILDATTSIDISRRKFVALSAGVSALAGLGLAGCSPKESASTVTEHEGPIDTEADAQWVTAACWHNCGGRCLNKALVKDGVVLRQKTDDTHEDSPDFPQQRACQRGRSQRMQVFGADRLKYPMKRKH